MPHAASPVYLRHAQPRFYLFLKKVKTLASVGWNMDLTFFFEKNPRPIRADRCAIVHLSFQKKNNDTRTATRTT
jgi:hypothetical protein